MAITTVVYFGVATHVTNSLESWAAPPCKLPKDSLHANATAGTSHCYWPKTRQQNDHELEKNSDMSNIRNVRIRPSIGEKNPAFFGTKNHPKIPQGIPRRIPWDVHPPVLASVSSSPWVNRLGDGMGRAENHLGTHNSEKNSMIVDIVSWKIWAAILCFIILISISNTNKTVWLLYVHVRLPLLSSDATRI